MQPSLQALKKEARLARKVPSIISVSDTISKGSKKDPRTKTPPGREGARALLWGSAKGGQRVPAGLGGPAAAGYSLGHWHHRCHDIGREPPVASSAALASSGASQELLLGGSGHRSTLPSLLRRIGAESGC